MVGKPWWILTLAMLSGLLNNGICAAQTSAQAQATAPDSQPDPLPGLPHPPEQPRSLFTPPPPESPPMMLVGPYFQTHPLLDPAELPPLGWFGEVDLGITVPHFKNRLVDTVPNGDTVTAPSADLNWTVAPRLEFGYRLPAAFGQFSMAYRFLATDGSATAVDPLTGGPVALKSRLDLNQLDFDYGSYELSLWPEAIMKWRLGLRLDNIYYDTTSSEPLAGLAHRVTDRFKGIGPHGGLELSDTFGDYGLSCIARLDLGIQLGRLRQGFFEAVPAGELRRATVQSVPMVNLQLGLGWQPWVFPQAHVFLGYEYEHWWNIGRDSDTTSRGELTDQGLMLQARIDF